MLPEFDAERFFLGNVCKRSHDWNGTGQSLRWKSTGECDDCKRARRVTYRQENLEQIKERDRQHRERNREKILEQKRIAYQNRDREKRQAYDQSYRERNKEKLSAYFREYRERNRDKIRLRQKRWKSENPDKVKASFLRYRIKNVEVRRIGLRRYRARKRKAHTYPYTPTDIQSRIQEFDQCCAYCGNKLELDKKMQVHLDHFLPLNKGGVNTISNMVPACIKCNSGKCDRDPLDWYQRQPFYSKQRWQLILKVLGKTPDNYNQLPLL